MASTDSINLRKDIRKPTCGSVLSLIKGLPYSVIERFHVDEIVLIEREKENIFVKNARVLIYRLIYKYILWYIYLYSHRFRRCHHNEPTHPPLCPDTIITRPPSSTDTDYPSAHSINVPLWQTSIKIYCALTLLQPTTTTRKKKILCHYFACIILVFRTVKPRLENR